MLQDSHGCVWMDAWMDASVRDCCSVVVTEKDFSAPSSVRSSSRRGPGPSRSNPLETPHSLDTELLH
ncbi:hypothetical protein ANCDUO_18740 [Ancylostoma duodenale]|uniref:Uncharacterized protein n=1 Tax=Ancylostoma duodenale TaxID=51022 RepID=A0A0C2G293_9BILA|nr:hypothetical protein ANCDUO_18740 [Ancylostoma duodenale]